jgi:hypothetical protein
MAITGMADLDDLTSVHDIDDVIDALGVVVDRARDGGERYGLFAQLYRRTTLEVRAALRTGVFTDAAWVERLDVVFARRYLDAFVAFERGRRTTSAWRHAFERGREPGHLLMQHLLLGMAAHILLDLGVATRDTEDGVLTPRRADFMAINAILAAMLDEVQDDVNTMSPAMAWIDRAGGRWDERVATAALRRWRATAWRRAEGLSLASAASRDLHVARIDRATARVGRLLCPPRPAAPVSLLRWARRDEVDDVPRLIDALAGRTS